MKNFIIKYVNALYWIAMSIIPITIITDYFNTILCAIFALLGIIFSGLFIYTAYIIHKNR